MPRGNPDKLKSLATRTTKERREIAEKGGKASGEARREKKRVSQILSEYLQKEHNVILRDADGNIFNTEKLSAQALIDQTVTAVLSRGDSASASMIKTLGELTEGSKVQLSGEDGNAPVFEVKIVRGTK